MTVLSTKDPDEVLDYSIDWSSWLNTGDSVSSAVWVVEAGLTKDSDSINGSITSVIVSGGTSGQDYKATCTMTTTNGLVGERCLTIPVKDCS